MLPAAGTHSFLWEISSGLVPDGATVRTFGRLSCYDLVGSQATLTASHPSAQQQICVGTRLVEPWHAQVGSIYMALGEVERVEGGTLVLQARVLSCVDGINLSLLERAVLEQRKYLGKREGPAESQGGTAP